MKPKKIGAFEAKTNLSSILDRVEQGAIYIITKRGRAVAELRPASVSRDLRFGIDAGRITVRDDFDAPLDDFREYSE
ncbi:MAG: type II toxin-antitoxin system Phd/YefM family antitoxin [Vicinamibacterales bacterium]